MAASKFNIDTCQAVCELLFDGLSLKDACRELNLREKTVKGWLTRGRKEEDGPYADFAASVDEIRQSLQERELPMDADELRLEVSRAAKKGSVAAQKLLWEMLRADDKDPNKESDDPFEQLDQGDDEIAAARAKRATAS